MSKYCSKKLTLLIAFVLVFSLAAAGCSSSTEPAGSAEDETNGESSYTIGYLNWGQGVPILDSFQTQAQFVNDVLGNTMTVSSDQFTANQQKTNIQNMIAAGVDGILFDGVPTTMIPDISAICEAAEMPFAIYDHTPSVETHKELTSNPYYVASVNLEGINTGASLAELALADGHKTAIIIGGAVGDSTHDERAQGFTETFEAGGGEVIGVARCIDPSEAATKGEDLVAAHSDADCLYALTGEFVSGPMNAMSNLGIKDMAIYSSCVEEITLGYIESGEVAAGNDGTAIPAAIAALLMQNYLDGSPILDESGKAPFISTNSFLINKDNAQDYRSVFLDDLPLTEDQVKNLCSRYNDNINYKAFTDFIENMTLDTIIEAHK